MASTCRRVDGPPVPLSIGLKATTTTACCWNGSKRERRRKKTLVVVVVYKVVTPTTNMNGRPPVLKRVDAMVMIAETAGERNNKQREN